MNSLIRRYSVGLPISERLKIARLWASIESKERKLSGEASPTLPLFGRVAVQFIREMNKKSRKTTDNRL